MKKGRKGSAVGVIIMAYPFIVLGLVVLIGKMKERKEQEKEEVIENIVIKERSKVPEE